MGRLKIFQKNVVLTINNTIYFVIRRIICTFASLNKKMNNYVKMTNVYILMKSEGQYDSRSEDAVAVFTDKSKAKEECKRLNDEMDELQDKYMALFGDPDDIDDNGTEFANYLEDDLAVKILQCEHPEYYNFYIKSNRLNDIDDNPKDIELSNKVYERIDFYTNEPAILCSYAGKFNLGKEVIDKIKVYTEYKRKSSYHNIYEGLPSYYVPESEIPLYN